MVGSLLCRHGHVLHYDLAGDQRDQKQNHSANGPDPKPLSMADPHAIAGKQIGSAFGTGMAINWLSRQMETASPAERMIVDAPAAHTNEEGDAADDRDECN
jgi:hypothetical protein